MRSFLPVLVPIVVGASALAAQKTPHPVTPRFEWAMHVDLHHWVRSFVHDRAALAPPEWLAQPIEHARALDAALPRFLGWSSCDLRVANSDSLDALAGDPIRPPRGFSGDVEHLQRLWDAYAAALAEAAPAFQRDVWPARRAVLEAAAGRIGARVFADPSIAIRNFEALGLPTPSEPVRVVLVSRTGWPGAFTYVSVDERVTGVCFVSVADEPDLRLAETLLHEMTHALDVQAGRDAKTVPNRIRAGLSRAGLERNDPRLRNAWHTIYFINSGETIRRAVDRAHTHYGDETGLYERIGAIASIQRAVWNRYLDGEIDVDEAVRRIVEEITRDD